MARKINLMRPTILLALILLACCDYDDPEYPRDDVDFITFSEAGRFREEFVGAAFVSGTMAVDTLGGPVAYPPRLGPGANLAVAIDDDVAPYPNPAGARKVTPHNGARDRRYWVQFAGGAWNSLNIEVDPRERYRASGTIPQVDPPTFLFWCPWTRPCMDWRTAVNRREARCFKYSVDGLERPVGPWTCSQYHPRQHWHVNGCGTCPVPAVNGPF